jgi:hypothetical protein
MGRGLQGRRALWGFEDGRSIGEERVARSAARVEELGRQE